MEVATARAHPNIALVKYWGRAAGSDEALNLPANSSLSMTMGGVATTTTVAAAPGLARDEVLIDGREAGAEARARVVRHLDRLRALAKQAPRLRVVSRSDFPAGAGLASSASAFAALTVAANEALGLGLAPRELSALARQGSGSAARSLFGGWVLWRAAARSEESVAEQVAPPEHLDVVDLVALVSRGAKRVGSAEGHSLAPTSPLHAARVAAAERWLLAALEAVHAKDLARLGAIAERDALAMHAVMMTSEPSLLYWEPRALEVLHAVRAWREEGLRCWFTIDAGPNVHVLVARPEEAEVGKRLRELGLGEGDVLRCPPGPGPELLREHLGA